ncbi:PrsW family intramembrane metalloprotease [Candidatus Peregrinibacteria bacterium]|nr:PrsW family intramembrane metalloprotease [Candidatus Peregrinibacteria bacterium]
MFENKFILLGISTFFAAIPVFVWLYFIFRKTEASKKTLLLVFGLGCLTAPALLGLQYVWDIFPRFNLSLFVQETFTTQTGVFIAMFMLFGAMEEIIKHYVISIIDNKTLLINTVNNTIRYSLAAALGFAFTENIYYLYEFWPSISKSELVGMYLFRSVFTACAHMIFSGIFGYYYAMGKFAIDIREQQKVRGKIKGETFNKAISKIFNLPRSKAYQQRMVLKGLTLAVVIHAAYNFILQMNVTFPVIIFVIVGALFMWYLMKRRTGNLIISTDISQKRTSTLAKNDEDVIIELLGLWFNSKRYVDVLHVCERLLQRDPDNKVVKLFKAKAMDRMEDKDNYKKILGSVIRTKEDMGDKEKNILSKHLAEKEMQKKVKAMIKAQLEKEGKKYIDYEKMKAEEKEKYEQEKATKAVKKDYIKNYTGKGTFKID